MSQIEVPTSDQQQRRKPPPKPRNPRPHHKQSPGQLRARGRDYPNWARTERGTPALAPPLENPQSKPRNEIWDADLPMPSPKLMDPANPSGPDSPDPKTQASKARPGPGNPEIQQKFPASAPIKLQQTFPRTPGKSKFPINYSMFKCGKSCATSWLLLCIVSSVYVSPDLCSPSAF